MDDDAQSATDLTDPSADSAVIATCGVVVAPSHGYACNHQRPRVTHRREWESWAHLKFNAQSGRYGVRLVGAQHQLLAVKRVNLEPLPFGIACDAPTTSSTILELPSNALEALVGHLSVRSMHVSLGATCALLNSVIKSDDAFWQAQLNHPLIAPYRATKMVNATAYCEALHIREQWHSGFEDPLDDELLACDRFVRSVAVDFDAHPHVTTIAIGLSSGAVASCCPKIFRRRAFRPDHSQRSSRVE